MKALIACILITSFLGCDESNESQDIEQACIDVGHEYGLSGERCGIWTYSEGRDAWIKQVGGDCSKTIAVRDYDELYEQCLPWIRTADCYAIAQDRLDTSCVGQILY